MGFPAAGGCVLGVGAGHGERRGLDFAVCPPSPCPASRGIISGGGQVSGASPPEDAASAHCALPGAFQAAQSTACRLLLLKGKNKSLMETKQREGPCLPFALPDLGPRALLLPQCAQLGTWRHRGENGKWVRTQGFPATPMGSALWPLRMGKKSLLGWDPAHTAGTQSSLFFFFLISVFFQGANTFLPRDSLLSKPPGSQDASLPPCSQSSGAGNL